MAHTVESVIEMLHMKPGPQSARFAAILERKKSEGMISMSLGTWEPGHPKDMEEWAGTMADMHESLDRRSPEQAAADERAGEDFLTIDSLECEKSGLLQLLGRVSQLHPTTKHMIDEYVSECFKTGTGVERRLVEIGAAMAQLAQA